MIVEVVIDYTNWRGERSKRRIIPVSIHFESNQFHPSPQWLLKAMDMDKDGVYRDFAISDIHSWETVE